MKNYQFRQGDVLIEQDILPENLEKVNEDENSRIVLAYGESTGHSHAIRDKNATLFVDKTTNTFYLMVKKPINVVHEEHYAINLPVGNYKVQIQKEYTPEAIRNVLD